MDKEGLFKLCIQYVCLKLYQSPLLWDRIASSSNVSFEILQLNITHHVQANVFESI